MMSPGFVFSVLRVELKLGLKYRGELLLNTTYLIFPMVIYFFMWASIYGHGGRIGDYSLKAILTYYLISLILYGTMPVFATSEVSSSIRDGRLTYFLTRPISHLGYFLSSVFGMSLVWLISNIIGMSVLILLMKKYLLIPSTGCLVQGAVFYSIGFAVAFLSGYLLQLSAFWFEDTTGILMLWDWAIGFAGGAIIPLDVLNFKLFDYLPFKYIYFLPAQALIGRIDADRFVPEVITGIAWITLLRIVAFLMWNAGLKRYEAPGG